MRNHEVAWVFQRIADLLEIKGAPSYKVRAYRRAAHSILALPRPVEDYHAEGRLTEIPGVGKALAGKIDEILASGTCRLLKELEEEVPPGLLEMLEVPGVGAKTAALVYRQLGITDLDGLERAARDHRLRTLPGMGGKKESNILHGIALVRRRPDRLPLGVARSLAESIREALVRSGLAERVEIAGSLRRWRETVGDIDLVAASPHPEQLVEVFTALPICEEVIEKGPTRARIRCRPVGQVDLRVVSGDEFPCALLYLTGSKEHNLRLRSLAQRKGLKLNEYGLFRGGERLAIACEADVYEALGLQWIPPELREDAGEIEAALRGELPRLIELDDIKGDLHVHTTWTDGTADILEMAGAAAELGYSYLAICDHSKSLTVAVGLDEKRLLEQKAAVERYRKRSTEPYLLAGVEVDILADGTLDLEESVLAGLDVVCASVHRAFRQSREDMTARLLRALRSPVVRVLGHPTGRLLGTRESCDIDLEAVMEAAAAEGKILEVNASPERLDLNDAGIRMAKAKGCLLAINTDAHGPAGLRDMRYGVGIARRAGVTPDMVINTWPLDRLLAYLRSAANT